MSASPNLLERVAKEAGKKAGKKAAEEVLKSKDSQDYWRKFIEDFQFTAKVRTIAQEEIQSRQNSVKTEVDREVERQLNTRLEKAIQVQFFTYLSQQSGIQLLIDRYATDLQSSVIEQCSGMKLEANARINCIQTSFGRQFQEVIDGMGDTVNEAAKQFAQKFTRTDENNILFQTIQNEYIQKCQSLTTDTQQRLNQIEQQSRAADQQREARVQAAEKQAKRSSTWSMISLTLTIASVAVLGLSLLRK